MSSDPPPIPPELREGAPLPEPVTVWTPRAERARVAAGGTGGSMEALIRMGAVSLNFVYSAAALTLLGWGVDYFAGTGPVGLLVGAGLGVVYGGYRFIREAGAMNRTQARSIARPKDPPRA